MYAQRFLGSILAFCFLVGCSDDDAGPAPGRGMPAAEREPAVDPVPTSAPAWAEEARANRRDDEDEARAPAPTGIVEVTEQTRVDVHVRDLQHELRDAFGDPSRCFSTLPPGANSVSVRVSGTVFEDGVVSAVRVSSSIAGPGISECLRGMQRDLRIASGVAGAPRSVSTTMTIER